MFDVVKVIAKLIIELRRTQAPQSFPERFGDEVYIPGQIAVDEKRFILTSREMDRLIDVAAVGLRHENPELSRTQSDKEWRTKVRAAFGPALAQGDLDEDTYKLAADVIAIVRANLRSAVKPTIEFEHAFGCTLFGDPNIAPFSIGPVTFEPRLRWLRTKQESGRIKSAIARRVENTWSGNETTDDASPREKIYENAIIGAVGECPYVCTVKTIGLGEDHSRNKAIVAARMAATAISLCWQNSSSALEGVNLLVDRAMRRSEMITFLPKSHFGFSGSRQGLPYILSTDSLDWPTVLREETNLFEGAAGAIVYFLSSDGRVERPNLMGTLCQALIWFHEGCREQVPLIAVVKFAACLDALAAGRRGNGIRRLITARLGIRDDQEIREYGPTLRRAVEEIYSSGRSRAIHGTSDQVGEDWSGTRALAHAFARLCLLACFDWAATHPNEDDPLRLLQK